jgi:hypothetical protein
MGGILSHRTRIRPGFGEAGRECFSGQVLIYININRNDPFNRREANKSETRNTHLSRHRQVFAYTGITWLRARSSWMREGWTLRYGHSVICRIFGERIISLILVDTKV